MKFLVVLKVALKAIARNKLRSSLTMLGIIIGVGAVIAMISIGQGAKASIEANIANAGTHLLIVMPGSWRPGGVHSGAGGRSSLKVEDAEAIVAECPAVERISPSASANAQVVYGNQNWFTSITGASEDYLVIRGWPLERGAYFNEQDVKAAARVCVLGKVVVENLFPSEDPVGKIIRIRKIPFTVTGVLSEKGQSGIGQNQDDTIVVPYTTVQKKLQGIQHLNRIFISARSGNLVPTAQKQIEELLRFRHKIEPGEEDDFTVRSISEMASVALSTTTILSYLLGSIASVSLIVGGIGIMNIMFVSVTERTREIGIRMAVGAKGSDILSQFLIEAVVLSSVGGVVGILLGVGVSTLISRLFQWPTLIAPSAVALAFLFSAAVGIFFGFYPARKASRLDPIESLRYE